MNQFRFRVLVTFGPSLYYYYYFFIFFVRLHLAENLITTTTFLHLILFRSTCDCDNRKAKKKTLMHFSFWFSIGKCLFKHNQVETDWIHRCFFCSVFPIFNLAYIYLDSHYGTEFNKPFSFAAFYLFPISCAHVTQWYNWNRSSIIYSPETKKSEKKI